MNNTEKLVNSHTIYPNSELLHIKYEASIIVLTYNPSIEKLLFTLKSLTIQNGISYEIIISDDGSNNNLFIEAVEYFESVHFHEYKLVPHKINQGTVRNSYDAIRVSEGGYVKLISPGDALFDSKTLSNWITFLKKSAHMWSFSNAIFYTCSDNNPFQIVEHNSYPHVINCYLNHNDNDCRWNYVVCGDYALGAATLCERQLVLSYTKKILDNVIYGEDCYYWLMMYDNIIPEYYPHNAVYYEIGYGISNSGDSPMHDKLLLDWKTTASIAFDNSQTMDAFQKRMKSAYNLQFIHNKLLRNLRQLFYPQHIKYVINRSISRKNTNMLR